MSKENKSMSEEKNTSSTYDLYLQEKDVLLEKDLYLLYIICKKRVDFLLISKAYCVEDYNKYVSEDRVITREWFEDINNFYHRNNWNRK